MNELNYQRLTGERPSQQFSVALFTRFSLWLASDHLLLVEWSGYTESYKRFYFRDIQAISFAQTNRYQWWTAITGFLALIFLAITIITVPKTSPFTWSSEEAMGGVVLGSVDGLCLALFVLNGLLGPTCKATIRTAVQVEDLPSLCRVRKTRAVLDRIRPFIVAVQGQLTAEEVSTRMQETIRAENPTELPQSASPGSVSATNP